MNSQSPFANIPPVVKNLLIINVLFFIGTYILGRSGINLELYLSCFYFNSPFFHPWQIVSYMFMHANIQHIFFNMFALFMFGPTIEYTLGSKRFLQYYFITGIGAVILQMIVQSAEVHAIIGTFTIPNLNFGPYVNLAGFEKLKDIYSTPILGASGAIFGVLLAFGYLFPNVEMMVLFIPMPIKAKYLIAGYIVIELIGGFGQFAGDSVAHFAHLGGALFGFIILKFWRVQRPNNFY
ncbi:rhomboid family intramembrane serine protease [Mucilaginibacter sp. HC2]|uniref:rhomboid family intramembrane serine protease n=1 Tax=Mucilaginibacter inviolabilis TaxID=2714892 RepID=UPI00140DC777|nr:rhomboid family intramembrane serine protease [Mucilaginibacter inviolabilis]NHA06415.1 rhomboid family intramembrane serine protease [Mucilaginibacter inviolabilis]